MTTFIQARLKKYNDQAKIDKYSSCKHYRISYYIKINLPKSYYSKIHNGKAIISCKDKCLN